MEMHIRPAVPEDRDALVDILDKVTLWLHDKGVNQWSYPWDACMIDEEIRNGLMHILEIDGLAVATFSIKNTDDIKAALIEPDNKYLYRIAVLPEYQGKSLGKEITGFAIAYAKKLGKSLYLDCWAGNGKLRSFYSASGFDCLGDEPEEDYYISVFRSK